MPGPIDLHAHSSVSDGTESPAELVAAGVAAGLGVLADAHGIEFVYKVCAWLPALGLLTVFLPRGVVRAHHA